jgi:hypothetical protein
MKKNIIHYCRLHPTRRQGAHRSEHEQLLHLQPLKPLTHLAAECVQHDGTQPMVARTAPISPANSLTQPLTDSLSYSLVIENVKI